VIPAGLCQCGCGEPTPIAKRTSTRKGVVKGQPIRYVQGHGNRHHQPVIAAPQLCECGCGQTTALADRTDSRRSIVKGQPLRFITGHNARLGATNSSDRADEKIDPPCRCGCGRPVTRISIAGDRYKHRTYILGHEPAPDALFVEAAAEIVMAVHDGGPDDFRDHLTDALALDTPDGVTAVEALVAALAALVDPDTRTATVTPVRAYLVALQDTAGAA
jgi:hypothetical protein